MRGVLFIYRSYHESLLRLKTWRCDLSVIADVLWAPETTNTNQHRTILDVEHETLHKCKFKFLKIKRSEFQPRPCLLRLQIRTFALASNCWTLTWLDSRSRLMHVMSHHTLHRLPTHHRASTSIVVVAMRSYLATNLKSRLETRPRLQDPKFTS